MRTSNVVGLLGSALVFGLFCTIVLMQPCPGVTDARGAALHHADALRTLCKATVSAYDGSQNSLRFVGLGPGSAITVGTGRSSVPSGPMPANHTDAFTSTEDLATSADVEATVLLPIVDGLHGVGASSVRLHLHGVYSEVMCAYHGCSLNVLSGCEFRWNHGETPAEWAHESLVVGVDDSELDEGGYAIAPNCEPVTSDTSPIEGILWCPAIPQSPGPAPRPEAHNGTPLEAMVQPLLRRVAGMPKAVEVRHRFDLSPATRPDERRQKQSTASTISFLAEQPPQEPWGQRELASLAEAYTLGDGLIVNDGTGPILRLWDRETPYSNQHTTAHWMVSATADAQDGCTTLANGPSGTTLRLCMPTRFPVREAW